MIAVTGVDVTGSSILYLIDTESRHLAVYQAQGGASGTQQIKLVGARNIDAIYEFLKVSFTPETGGLLGNETGYNPVSVGAADHLDEASKTAFNEAYPEDALDRLWWWPAEGVWYASARAEFRDKFVAA